MKVIENERIAPRARKVPVELEKHGDIRIDNYFWLRERENPEVLDYLTQENLYNEQMTAHTKELQENLFQEVKGRIKEDDSSVPYKLNGYWYITRFEKGKDYPIYSRKKESLDAPEEILFDVNKMAKGHDYYKLSGLSVSPNNKLISYAVDTVSRRKYTLYIKNLETGEVYSEKIRNTTGGATWANDNKTLFYARKDEETLRSNKIFKHRLGTKAK
ncbi:MAG: oligopeptidase B, partial [Salinimicrobium sediminis]|nr:oligopeptidase B [Salinimicrobium sediminis]